MEGRPIIREANLKQYQDDPHFADKMNEAEPRSGATIREGKEAEPPKPLYPNPFDEVKKSGDDCSAAYESGATVTLTATANPGATFVGWSGATPNTETVDVAPSNVTVSPVADRFCDFT